MTTTRATLVSTNARIDAIEGKIDNLAAMLATFVDAQAPAKPVSAPEPKAPKATPEFIVVRATNRERNKNLAAVLRAFDIEPKGAAWTAAKAAQEAGKTKRQIVAAARKA